MTRNYKHLSRNTTIWIAAGSYPQVDVKISVIFTPRNPPDPRFPKDGTYKDVFSFKDVMFTEPTLGYYIHSASEQNFYPPGGNLSDKFCWVDVPGNPSYKLREWLIIPRKAITIYWATAS